MILEKLLLFSTLIVNTAANASIVIVLVTSMGLPFFIIVEDSSGISFESLIERKKHT
jgi:hypothetical protein